MTELKDATNIQDVKNEELSLHVVLFEPEIPQNAGNIARTCACCGATLHLVEPMGFRLTQKNLTRAGLDYWDKVDIVRHSCASAFLEEYGHRKLLFFTGQTNNNFYDQEISGEVFLIFGRESRGIDPEILEKFPEQCVRIPMKESLRSLNLSNSVAIGVYEALRQNSFVNLV